MELTPITIAVLNEDQLYRHLVSQLLAEEGYRTIASKTGAEAYPIVRAATGGGGLAEPSN
jgi:CheY-like chemotaxis protein